MRRPQWLETKSKLEMLYWLAITEIRREEMTASSPISDVCPDIYLKNDLTAAWLQDAEVKWMFVFCYKDVLIFLWTGAIVSSPNVFPFLHYSKTSAVWNIWSSITPQTQSACKIALSNQVSCCSALLCCRSAVSLVKWLFLMGFKTDFIKCSISKWATHHSRKVMATLATRAGAKH